MSALDTAMYAVHLAFAGLWTGSVLFVTVGVLPAGRDGSVRPAPLELAVGRLRLVSRASAVLLLVSGGYMFTAAGYEGPALLESTPGVLVAAMVVLWAALMGLVEVGAGRLADGLAADKVREPVRESRRLFQAASLVAVALLLVGGALAGPPL